jgi:hypothetical protein
MRLFSIVLCVVALQQVLLLVSAVPVETWSRVSTKAGESASWNVDTTTSGLLRIAVRRYCGASCQMLRIQSGTVHPTSVEFTEDGKVFSVHGNAPESSVYVVLCSFFSCVDKFVFHCCSVLEIQPRDQDEILDIMATLADGMRFFLIFFCLKRVCPHSGSTFFC